MNLRKSVSFINKENKITSLTAIILKDSMGLSVSKDLEYWGLKSVTKAVNVMRVTKTNLNLDIARQRQKEQNGDVDFNIYKDAARLEQILNRAIDLDKCNVNMWVEYGKLAKQINKQKNG